MTDQTEIREALTRVSEIHALVLRQSRFHGFRAWPVAATGCIAMLAAAFQPIVPHVAFVPYWLHVAAIAATLCFGEIAVRYALESRESERRKTRHALAQLLPSIAAGTLVTFTLCSGVLPPGDAARLLPGLWALLYALGLFATRPLLPRQTGFVALGFLVAGAGLLFASGGAGASGDPSHWAMGLTFGLGQFGLASVLRASVERSPRAST